LCCDFDRPGKSAASIRDKPAIGNSEARNGPSITSMLAAL
jgi:hypothetical protein